MKIYIAGPMRDIPEFNFPAFFEAEKVLQKEGWETINPAEIDINEGFDTTQAREALSKADLEKFILRDVHLVVSADAICLLPGWQGSRGVAVELATAKYCELPIYYITDTGRITR